MHTEEVRFSYEVYDGSADLAEDDAMLLQLARQITASAYAPYSRFRVGAAARLLNGEIITGTNQENASFPAGICAERTLLSVASSLYPGMGIQTIAVSYDNENGPSDHPISPCGICRQSLQEFGQRTGRPVRLILGGLQGKVYIIPRADWLMPLAFTSSEL